MGTCDVKVDNYTGLLFQLQGDVDEGWKAAKEEAIRYIKEQAGKGKYDYVLICDMPCGNSLKLRSYKEIRQLPIKDVPCPCGDPTHWLIRYKRFRQLKNLL